MTVHTVYLVTIDGETSRWNGEAIQRAKENHQATLRDPQTSGEAKARARKILKALDKAVIAKDQPK